MQYDPTNNISWQLGYRGRVAVFIDGNNLWIALREGHSIWRMRLDDGIRTGVDVSPAGNVVVWEKCTVVEPYTCDIYKAVRAGGSWTVSAVTADVYDDFSPRTDGVSIAYVSVRNGETDVYWQPVAGGTEQRLELPGQEVWLSLAGGLIAVSSIADGETAADLYAYHMASNRLFRITSTPNTEYLNDVAVLADGRFRLVWDSGPDFDHRDVYGITFALPPIETLTFGGFLQPVDPYPTLNVMKAGAAVPVRFSLGGFHGLGIFAAGYPKSQTIGCTSSSPQDDVEQTVSAGSSSLSYDATTDQYSYIWKTDKSWSGTCRQLVIRLADNTDHVANFKFK